ncbi:MAG: hypothetical protein LBF65_02690 [Holosporales bacterium]|nr:hypothetical protein [Holosporales bacterium]
MIRPIIEFMTVVMMSIIWQAHASVRPSLVPTFTEYVKHECQGSWPSQSDLILSDGSKVCNSVLNLAWMIEQASERYQKGQSSPFSRMQVQISQTGKYSISPKENVGEIQSPITQANINFILIDQLLDQLFKNDKSNFYTQEKLKQECKAWSEALVKAKDNENEDYRNGVVATSANDVFLWLTQSKILEYVQLLKSSLAPGNKSDWPANTTKKQATGDSPLQKQPHPTGAPTGRPSIRLLPQSQNVPSGPPVTFEQPPTSQTPGSDPKGPTVRRVRVTFDLQATSEMATPTPGIDILLFTGTDNEIQKFQNQQALNVDAVVLTGSWYSPDKEEKITTALLEIQTKAPGKPIYVVPGKPLGGNNPPPNYEQIMREFVQRLTDSIPQTRLVGDGSQIGVKCKSVDTLTVNISGQRREITIVPIQKGTTKQQAVDEVKSKTPLETVVVVPEATDSGFSRFLTPLEKGIISKHQGHPPKIYYVEIKGTVTPYEWDPSRQDWVSPRTVSRSKPDPDLKIIRIPIG